LHGPILPCYDRGRSGAAVALRTGPLLKWSSPLARECDVCGKKPLTGWNSQSVGMNRKRALRRWLPNLQPTMIERDGRMIRVKSCSRCRRTAEKV
jgi:ribosomal protein L28